MWQKVSSLCDYATLINVLHQYGQQAVSLVKDEPVINSWTHQGKKGIKIGIPNNTATEANMKYKSNHQNGFP